MVADLVSEFKWLFLIIGEVVFWVSISGFFILRYIYNQEKSSKYFILIWLLSDLWLLVIGILDYRNTGEFDTFQIIIIIFLLYAFTFGKNDIKKLDRWIRRAIKKWKGIPLDESDVGENLYGMAYAFNQGKEFALHAILFVVAIMVFSFFADIRNVDEIFSTDFGDSLGRLIENGLFQHAVLGKVTGIWLLIFIIDAIITISYFIFPKKKKST